MAGSIFQQRVFTIPAGDAFLESLVTGILREYQDSIDQLPFLTIYLPNNRSKKVIGDIFLQKSPNKAVFLPRIISLGDDFADLNDFKAEFDQAKIAQVQTAMDITPPILPLNRQCLLAHLITAYAAEEFSSLRSVSPAQAMMLAFELGKFLDQAQTENIDFTALENLVPDDLSEHWQQTVLFLDILRQHWPKILNERGVSDPVTYRNTVLAAQCALWELTPPAHPIIVAGTTGSIPATADLMKTVSDLKNGCVVLPGLMDLPAETWKDLCPTHPQYLLGQTLKQIDVTPQNVALWPASQNVDSALWQQVFLPAAHTHEWQVGDAPVLPNLAVYEGKTLEEEATYISLVVRQALEIPDQTVAVITADTALAERLTQHLKRWGVDLDDAGTTPLLKTPTAVFFLLMADVVVQNWHPVALLSFLDHPLCELGKARQDIRQLSRKLNTGILRGLAPAGLDGLQRLCEERPELAEFVESIAAALKPLQYICRQKEASFQEYLQAHIQSFEKCVAPDFSWELEDLTDEDAHQAFHLGRFLVQLSESTIDIAVNSLNDYLEVLGGLFAQQKCTTHRPAHPRAKLYGLMEARLQKPDVVIMAGLNEGSWPPDPEIDPWMSRPMRKQFGLQSPDVRVGQTAHDFCQHVSAKEVHLTRAKQDGGKATLPSRFLMRVKAYADVKGVSKTWPQTREDLQVWGKLLDGQDIDPAVMIAPPAPCPPQSARPTTMYVTHVEQLQRDPYGFYAKHILKLEKLNPLAADPAAMDYGKILHSIFETYLSTGVVGADALKTIGAEAFSAFQDRAGVLAFWQPRFLQVADWFLETEKTIAPHRQKVLCEVQGEMSLTSTLTLSAHADRLDILRDGTVTVIDYKTGQPPKTGEVKAGLSPQLVLEGVLVANGGFPGVRADTSQVGMQYWHLKGGREGGKIKFITDKDLSLLEETKQGVIALLEEFQKAETPYLSAPNPDHRPKYSDYDHLAREEEWRRFVA